MIAKRGLRFALVCSLFWGCSTTAPVSGGQDVGHPTGLDAGRPGLDASSPSDGAVPATDAGGCDPARPCTVSGAAGLCKANVCAACSNGSDDAACAQVYGAGSVCLGGACVQAQCQTDHDCATGQICALVTPHTCSPCDTDSDCHLDQTYGLGTICLSGACTPGNCHDDTFCASGQICGLATAHTCAPCGGTADCVADLGYGPGFLCAAGACVMGNCNADGDCSAGQICGLVTAHVCATCTADAQCKADTNYGAPTICVAGSCVVGDCHANADCTGGKLCGLTLSHLCAPCVHTSDCTGTGGYGTGYVCAAGACVKGDCVADGDCAAGQICGLVTAHTCAPCATTASCVADTGYGTGYVCATGACVLGNCLGDGDCSAGQICGLVTANVCALCSADAQCQADAFYGSGTICASGACVPGNCHSSGDCTGGQVCGKGGANRCGACATIAECQADPVYGVGNVCLAGGCVPGDCLTDADCATGRICGASLAHWCGGCAGNAQCVADATYGAGYVCAGGMCEQGNCATDAACAPGEICGVASAHVCGGCTADSQCQADPGYGAGTLCFGGACVPGNCHQSTECTLGRVCGATHACGACAASADCQADPAYGPGTVCVTGACVTGDCATTADCSSGQLCGASVAHQCGGCTGNAQCQADSRYGSGYLCASGTCVAGDCVTDTDCAAGHICGLLVPFSCAPCALDSDCATDPTYGAGTICVAGACKAGNCHTDADCSSGYICGLAVANVCAPCGATADCLADAGYGAGHICAAGACVIGNCVADGDCLAGQICGLVLANQCAPCAVDGDCTSHSYGSGTICVAGGCLTGNCHRDADCAAGQMCAVYACAPCARTSDCLADPFYGANHVCLAGACVPGDCLTSADCLSGELCGVSTAHFCGSCGGDPQCVADPAYGAGFICVSGGCLQGNCHVDADCPAGHICGLSKANTCASCALDADCVADPGYGSGTLCVSGGCVTGNCHGNADCASGHICGLVVANTCAACGATTDCTGPKGYGAGYVCAAGSCVAGNCTADADCGPGQICGLSTPNQCGTCTADTQCKADPTYGATTICVGGRCLTGNCHTSADCAGGWICGVATANACGACATVAQCQGDPAYGSGDVCVGGACKPGDCLTSADCVAGEICGVSQPNYCGNCTTDPQCKGDARYGATTICVAGACVVGDCHGDADCGGRICGLSVPNTCASCTGDGQCQAAPGYGPTYMCNVGTGHCVPKACAPNFAKCTANPADFCCTASCVAGNCCVAADCAVYGNNYSCVSNTCTKCPQAAGNAFYVDPVGGNDTVGTGSNATPGCAFKTITRALQFIGGAPNPNTQVLVMATGTVGTISGETFPIAVPTNVTISGTGGTPTVLVTAARNGFTFAAAASGLSNLAIDGQSHTANTAVTVNNALATVSASDLGITNFRLDGIAVSAGALAIGKGVSVTGSGIAAAAHDGLHVTGGRVTVTVPAGSTATRFDGNTNHGIEVNTTGGITIAGVAGTNGVGTVTANSNTVNGVFIQQTAGAAVAVNRVSGLVAWANRANGLRVYGGSALVLRRSYLLANLTDGVLVSTGAGATGNDLTKMDLGIATDFGHNTFQALPGNNPNFGAGICLSLGNNVNQTLRAEGNIYSGPIDCSTSTATLLRNTTCSGAVDVSSTRNLPRIDVLNCL